MTTGQIATQIETPFRQEHSKVLAVLIATPGDFALAIDIVDFRQHQFEYKNERRIKMRTKMSF
jgi:hypothetical protein